LVGLLHLLRQELDMRVHRQHLSALARIQIRDSLQRLLLGARQVIAIAHAEGIVDADDQHLAATSAHGSSADKRIREGQRDEQQKQYSQRQEQQIAEAAVLDGTLRPLLEEHQRAEGMRCAAVLTQQMDPEGQADGG
jgi:hypothetical protein